MHVIWNLMDVLHSYVLWQESVEFVGQVHLIQRGGTIEVSYHHTGMDSCVCTTCSYYLNGLTE